MEDDWYLTPEQTAAGEWYSWDPATATGHEAVAAAVAHFEAHAERNDLAAKKAMEWLRQDALREHVGVTRALVADGKVATFYGLASGEVTLTSSKKLERMGILGGSRVGSSHIEWIARDRRAHPGAGKLAVKHAIDVALHVAELQGNRAVTLDPFDAETQAMWEEQGFHRSRTELDHGLRRLYVPLFGADYGPLKRATRASRKAEAISRGT